MSCMGAKASQPTHFLKFRLTEFRLNGVDCIHWRFGGFPHDTIHKLYGRKWLLAGKAVAIFITPTVFDTDLI